MGFYSVVVSEWQRREDCGDEPLMVRLFTHLVGLSSCFLPTPKAVSALFAGMGGDAGVARDVGNILGGTVLANASLIT